MTRIGNVTLAKNIYKYHNSTQYTRVMSIEQIEKLIIIRKRYDINLYVKLEANKIIEFTSKVYLPYYFKNYIIYHNIFMY